jgi:nucleoside-diphosphate-sugar epimerase
MPSGMKVLVTGASGRIGQAFRQGFKNYYSLKLVYHRSPVRASANEEVVTADITDLNSMSKAMKDAEAVVHLAADPRVTAPWNSVLKMNIEGTYNVFESARRADVKKIVFASSNHACGFAVEESGLVGPDAPVRPDSLYGVSKVFGEALGRYYSERFGISVICLRIGICRRGNPTDFFKKLLSSETTHPVYTPEKIISMWISERDMAQLIHRSLETDLKFGIFYATSDNTPRALDISEAERKLGYKPQDKAQDYLD